MGITEKQPEGIQFIDRDGRVSINNLDLNLDDKNNDNSNAPDESFDYGKEYQEEFDREGNDDDLTTNEVKDDHFQLPFQQNHAHLIDKPSNIRSAKVRSVKELKKKTKKHKRQKI